MTNITIITPPDYKLIGKPKIFLYGDGDSWKNEVISYANTQFTQHPITFYYDDNNTASIEWIFRNVESCDLILLRLSDETFTTNQVLLGYILAKPETWVVNNIDNIELIEYINLCEHLNKNLVDNDILRQFSKMINQKYKS